MRGDLLNPNNSNPQDHMQKLWLLVIVVKLHVAFLAYAVAAIVEENLKLCP